LFCYQSLDYIWLNDSHKLFTGEEQVTLPYIWTNVLYMNDVTLHHHQQLHCYIIQFCIYEQFFTTKMKLYYFTFSNKSLSLFLHVLYNSVLLWRVAPSGENMIKYFSFKHCWQVFVTGLKTLPLNCFKIYQHLFINHLFSKHEWCWADLPCALQFGLVLHTEYDWA
jgi:hypothetical protein